METLILCYIKLNINACGQKVWFNEWKNMYKIHLQNMCLNELKNISMNWKISQWIIFFVLYTKNKSDSKKRATKTTNKKRKQMIKIKFKNCLSDDTNNWN